MGYPNLPSLDIRFPIQIIKNHHLKQTRIVSVFFFCGAARSKVFLNMTARGVSHNSKWPSPQAAILRSGFVQGQPQALQVQVIKYWDKGAALNFCLYHYLSEANYFQFWNVFAKFFRRPHNSLTSKKSEDTAQACGSGSCVQERWVLHLHCSCGSKKIKIWERINGTRHTQPKTCP